MRKWRQVLLGGVALAISVTVCGAETCITQSAMQPAERTSLVSAASSLATLTAAGDVNGLRAQTIPQFAQDFSGIAETVRGAQTHLRGAAFVPKTAWILDNTLAPGKVADAIVADAQFFCTLNKSAAQTSFLIPALPPGRYGLVVLDTAGVPEPWQLAFLLKSSGGNAWQLGGVFPRATTAAGHDGLWFWRAARDFATKNQRWNAFLYFNQAEQLLKPVAFVSSTHLDALQAERMRSTPAALSAGIGSGEPLVIARPGGPELRVTSLEIQDAPNNAGLDVLAHVASGAAIADVVAARAKNLAAAKALVAAYPELRTGFHGVWIVADTETGNPFVSEEAMAALAP